MQCIPVGGCFKASNYFNCYLLLIILFPLSFDLVTPPCVCADSGLRARSVMESKDQSRFHSLCFRGPTLNPTRLCLKPEACWLSFVNKCEVHVHVSHLLSDNVTPYGTYFMSWVTVRGRYRWCICLRVYRECGKIINLPGQHNEWIRIKDFISCSCTMQDICSFHWPLCYFKVTVDVNIWILIHIFPRKCSNASLN